MINVDHASPRATRKLSEARVAKIVRLHDRDCPGVGDVERPCRQCIEVNALRQSLGAGWRA